MRNTAIHRRELLAGLLVFCPVSNFCIDELSKAYPHALEFMQCPLADASNRSI